MKATDIGKTDQRRVGKETEKDRVWHKNHGKREREETQVMDVHARGSG